MSSSFLYLAIVGVWAFFLVPRWLRRQYARAQQSIDHDLEVNAEYAAEYEAGAQYYYEDDVQDPEPGGYSPESDEATYPAGAAGAGERGPGPAARPTRARVPVSRSRMLRSRRRLLMMHLLLLAVAGACVGLKITSWLVVIPPAAMLGMYLLLLREASVADAEQARRRADLEARIRAARDREYTEGLAREPEPSAEVIDISARVGDQLYDQYADATVRAVGD